MLTRPPLGPPCFSARALSSAAIAAQQRPRTQRRPLVHALLLFSSDAPRLFTYAREVLDIFSNHGIDIYLQTDVSDAHSAPRPITIDNVEDILATSQIEFFILVTEQNISRRTIQVRVGTQFAEREIEEHVNFILDTWASAIERDLKREHEFALGMNPNVVTNKHIDFLLQQHPRLRDIRTAYAALARLVKFSQKWLIDENEQHIFGTVTASTRRETDSSLGSPTSKSTESTDKTEQADKFFQTVPVPESSCEISKDEMDKLSKEALSQGLKAVLSRNEAEIADNLEVLKKQSPSMSWIKRSRMASARLLRGQFLVRSIHSRLVDTFPVISSAPLDLSPEKIQEEKFGVPSEAHRQRLLREVNFLVARMEELGSRLSRRLKTKRRQRIISPVNPWTTYINRTVTTISGNTLPHDNGYYCFSDEGGSWICIGCHSSNRRSSSCCRSCNAPSCVLERGLLPDASEAMTGRVREAIKSSALQRMPWIFAPSPTSVSPPSASTSVPVHGNLGRGPETAPFTMSHMTGSTTDPIRIPQVLAPNSLRASGRQQSPDLLNGFRDISLDDGISNGQSAHRLYETPSRSPEAVRGSRSGLTQFPMANGVGISKVNAIPIARSRNLEGSPPSRSPDATDYFSNVRARMSEEGRAASLDANLLGNRLHRASNHWFGHDNPLLSRATQNHVGNAEPLLGRSPPLYRSMNGTSDCLLEMRTPQKGDTLFNINSERNTTAPRSFDHFSNAAHLMVHGNGIFPARSAESVPHMQELAIGSIEAQNFSSRYMSSGAQNVFPPLGALEQRSALEDLAAASDAANGGLGSATTESLRAVMALRSSNDRESGGYGLF